MRLVRKRPLGPYFAVLGALFMLSVAAPSSWHQPAVQLPVAASGAPGEAIARGSQDHPQFLFDDLAFEELTFDDLPNLDLAEHSLPWYSSDLAAASSAGSYGVQLSANALGLPPGSASRASTDGDRHRNQPPLKIDDLRIFEHVRNVATGAAGRFVLPARVAETWATEVTRFIQATPLQCDVGESATTSDPARDAVADRDPRRPRRAAGPLLASPTSPSPNATDFASRPVDLPVGHPPRPDAADNPANETTASSSSTPSPAVTPSSIETARAAATTESSQPQVIVRDSNERLAMAAPNRRSISAAVAQPKQRVLTPPVRLLKDLRKLIEIPHSADWSGRLESELRKIADWDAQRRRPLRSAVTELDAYVDEALSLAAEAPSAATRTAVLRARYALIRRLAIWNSALDLDASFAAELRKPAVERTIALPRNVPGRPDSEAPFNSSELTLLLERYEATGSPSYGRQLATLQQRMLAEQDPLADELVFALDQHYRNANLRFAVSKDLMERFLPPLDPVAAPVRDRINGAAVAGQSLTQTQLGIRLVPDSNHLRFNLEAKGIVTARTASSMGPATFQSSARSNYLVSKTITVTPQGVHLAPPAVADAQSFNRLRGVRTKYDPIPLLGDLARKMARDEHERARGRTRYEIRRKIADRARTQMDQQADPKIAAAERRIRETLFAPIDSLGVARETVELKTTAKRLIGRFRLAAEDQVAAHTPRPQAPGDSLVSIQLHESTFNNLAQQFDLAGRTFELAELYGEIGRKIGRPDIEAPVDIEPNTHITFAETDPIRVRCEGGRMEIILSAAEIKHRRTEFHNFKVHAFYVPEVEGMKLKFVRDGVLQIEGSRLRPMARNVLHGVFVKVFSRNRPFPVLPDRLQADPRLKDLMLTQVDVDDGWLGLAVGPQFAQRMAHRVRPERPLVR